MTNFSEPYNFTKGNEVVGSATHTNISSLYDFSIDLELITCILIVIMICLIVQTSYIFLSHIGLIKRKW